MEPKNPPTMRSLAAELGVSAITVSRALRDSGEVRPALKNKIERLARRRGYSADPVLATVMGRLGRGKGRAYLETVAFVWTHRLGTADAEYRGACSLAEKLGYRVEPVRPWEQNLDEDDVTRILWARGIRGVLLAPNHSSAEPSYELDWARFCPVLIGSSLRNIGIARVQRDYFNDARLALDRLRSAGGKRVGLVLDAGIHERTQRQYAAAFLAHAGITAWEAARLIHVVDAGVAPAGQRRAWSGWLRREKPDTVLADFGPCPAWLREEKAGGKIGYASLALGAKDARLRGVVPDFERIGAEAMRVLDGLLRAGQAGLHASPVKLLVPGVWRDAGVDG